MSDAESFNNDELEKTVEIPTKRLQSGDMPACLSLLCKIDSGLAHAYVKITATKLKLTSVELLEQYKHLRYVDVSQNYLSELGPINHLRSLLWLKANNNKIISGRLDEFPYLQVIDLSFNQIGSTLGIEHPLLEQLNLNNNNISSADGFTANKLPSLTTLQMRSNCLTSTAGLENFKNLKHLFLANNSIQSLEGITTLENLEILHLRGNQLTVFEDNFQAGKNTKLKYINFRSNSISEFSEINKLDILEALECINLMENPIVEENEYRVDVLVNVRKLNKLDKDIFEEDEIEMAQEKYEMKVQEEKDAAAAEAAGEEEEEE